MADSNLDALLDAAIGADCTICGNLITNDDAARTGVHMDYDPRHDETPTYRHGFCDRGSLREGDNRGEATAR